MESSVYAVPYKTARAFHSPFTYTFPLTGGQKFLRLYFYPNVYSDVNLYSLSLRTDTPSLENLYRLNVGGDRVVIEEDSGMFRGRSPDDDYIFCCDYRSTPHKERFVIKYTNQTPPYTAPTQVYTSARTMNNCRPSLEWIADPGVDVILFAGGRDIPIFREYITRLPDAGNRGKQDLRLSLGKREFIVNIGATQRLDLTFTPNPNSSAVVNGIEIVSIPDKLYLGRENEQITFDNSFINPLNSNTALENLYRLNVGGARVAIEEDSCMFRGWSPDEDYVFWCDYGLTQHNEEAVIKYNNRTPRYTAPPNVYSAIRIVVVVTAVMFLINRQQQKEKDAGTRSTAGTNRSGVSLPCHICRYFSINEINTATSNFDDNFIIGRGGFGNVYKGLIDNAATTLAHGVVKIQIDYNQSENLAMHLPVNRLSPPALDWVEAILHGRVQVRTDGSTRVKRGPFRSKYVWNLRNGDRIVVECNEYNQPDNKGGRVLGGWLEMPDMADVVKGLELAMILQQDNKHPTEQVEEDATARVLSQHITTVFDVT
ncbi:hypothetical protein SASPL_131210 [Salvia splendens]|uniref:Malectin-like domain-containing protein n=1 Tax=Salvia splendens TaxID=180675 RepID=A0A8X8ZKN0_SALSN|nr:hypothetical protein SASPL_131210 [Salvia splendens]